MKLLVENFRYPSLRAKKYDESRNIWQARINRDWRFYLIITGDTCLILNIIPHSKKHLKRLDNFSVLSPHFSPQPASSLAPAPGLLHTHKVALKTSLQRA